MKNCQACKDLKPLRPPQVTTIQAVNLILQIQALALGVIMDSSFWFDTINLGWFIVHMRSHRLNYSFSEYCFIFTNSVDPDEMLHYATFHQDIHCLSKYSETGVKRSLENKQNKDLYDKW